MGKKAPTFEPHADSQTEGLLAASCGDEEGHFAYRCPARSLLQRLLQQEARETVHGPARGQVLELPAPECSQGSPPGAFKLLGGHLSPR